jgi:hypothetical protein
VLTWPSVATSKSEAIPLLGKYQKEKKSLNYFVEPNKQERQDKIFM